MTDISGLPEVRPEVAQEWHSFFVEGGTYAVALDRESILRLRRGNTVVLSVIGGILFLIAAGIVALAVTDLGRIATYILTGLLFAAVVIVFLKYFFMRRRLTGPLVAEHEYLAVTAQGLRMAGALELPWSQIATGIGWDMRGIHRQNRMVAAVSKRAGEAQAEIFFAVRDAQATRDAGPARLRRFFFLGGEFSQFRVPLDGIVAPDDVPRILGAVHFAAATAGVVVAIPSDSGKINRAMVPLSVSGTLPDELL